MARISDNFGKKGWSLTGPAPAPTVRDTQRKDAVNRSNTRLIKGQQAMANPLAATPKTTQESLEPLYARAPGVVKADDPTKAATTGYDVKTQSVSDDAKASNQLNKITSQESPLMQRAQQQGMLSAASRGIQNSSIAAGAAQGAMVDRAAPIAMQDARTTAQQDLTNQASENREAEFGATAGNQASLQQAGAQTQVNQTNAAAENTQRDRVMSINADINKQYLAGSQALDLAGVEGRYKQLISSNQTAASLYDGYFKSIAETMSNNNLDPKRVAQNVAVQQRMLEAGLRMMDLMNGVNIGRIPFGNAAGGTTSGTAPSAGGYVPTAAPSRVNGLVDSRAALQNLARNRFGSADG